MTHDQILVALLTGVEAILLVISFRRSGLLLMPNGALLLIIYYQIIYLLAHDGVVRNDVLSSYAMGGMQARFWDAEYFYAALFGLLFVFGLGLKAPNRKAAVNAAFATLNEERLAAINRAAAIAVSIYLLLYAASVKWSVIWSNEKYLAMIDPAQVGAGGPLAGLAISLLVPVGVATACLCAINMGRNQYRYALVFAGVWVFVATLQLGAHQRGATLVSGMFLLSYIALAPKPNWPVLLAAVGFATISYPSALAGRILTQQGLASIPGTLNMLFELGSSDFVNLALTNIGEGIFTFGESLMAPVSYPDNYKMLSFSPFPSAIDGFATIRDVYQMRLSPIVPLSGYAEALKFGPDYAALLAFYFFGAIRLNVRLQSANQLASLLVNTFIFLAFFMLNAYALRSGLRLLVVAVAVAVAVLIYDSWRRPPSARAVTGP